MSEERRKRKTTRMQGTDRAARPGGLSETGGGGEPAGAVRDAAARPRRRLTAERKFQVFLECAIPGAPIGEVLRREGLYSSDLARIRQQVRDGALARLKQGPGRRRQTLSPPEVARLVQDLAIKERALAALSVEYLALKNGARRGSTARSGSGA
jgi:transposase-like protein